MESGYDIQKVYRDSLKFLMLEKQRHLNTEAGDSVTDLEKYKFGVSSAADGRDHLKFEADVMFSSANITKGSDSHDMAGDTRYTTSSIKEETNLSAEDAGNGNSMQQFPDIQIKKEQLSDDEITDSSYMMETSAVSQEMDTVTQFSPNSEPIHTGDFSIKQESLSYDDGQTSVMDDAMSMNQQFTDSLIYGENYWRYHDDVEPEETSTMVSKENSVKVRRSRRPKKPKFDENFGYEFDYDSQNMLDTDDNDWKNEEKKSGTDFVFPQSAGADSGDDGGQAVPCSFNISIQNKLDHTVEMKQMQMNVFRCTVCGALFTYNSLLQKHMRKHTNDYSYRCRHCDCGFVTQYSMDLHSKLHNPDKLYECGMCGELIKLRKDLKLHHDIHKREKYKSDVKERQAVKVKQEVVESTSKIVEETPSHTKRLFGCSICNFSAADFAAIGNHVMSDHIKERICICEICCAKFQNNDGLLSHLVAHSDPKATVQCGLCVESYPDQDSLLTHLDSHESAKPYMCLLCNAKFIALPHLQTHIGREHSVTKGYSCEFCDKQFYHQNTLTSHMRVHTGEISFKCEECGKGFRVKERLERHMREHSNTQVKQTATSKIVKTAVVDNQMFQQSYYNHVNVNDVTKAEDDQTNYTYPSENTNETYIKEEADEEVDENVASTNESAHWNIKQEYHIEASGSSSYSNQLVWNSGNLKFNETADTQPGDHENTTEFSNNENVDNNGNSEAQRAEVSQADDTLPMSPSQIKREPDEVSNSWEGDIMNTKMEANSDVLGSTEEREITLGKRDTTASNDVTDGAYDVVNPLPQIGMQKVDTPHKTPQTAGSTMFSIAVKKVTKSPFGLENGNLSSLDYQTGEVSQTLKLNMNIHQCKVCGSMHAYKNQLQKHMLKHTGRHPINCDVCGKGFSTKQGFKLHYTLHSGERPYSCNVCGRSFRQKNNLRSHILVHSEKEPFECEYCSRRYRVESELKRHMQLHLKSIPFSCGICSISVSKSEDLEVHVTTEHFNGKPFACSVCSKRFPRNEDCDVHLSYHYSSNEHFLCGVCDESFEDRSEMVLHLGDHSEAKPFRCNFCSARYIVLSDLKEHVTAHAKLLQVHDCPVCKREFPNDNYLQEHLRIHTGECPYECSICNQTFRLKSSLEKHLRHHTGEKPYKCKHCDKTFTTRSSKFSHQASHKNDTIQTCSMCGEMFNRKGKFKAHLAMHKKTGKQIASGLLEADKRVTMVKQSDKDSKGKKNAKRINNRKKNKQKEDLHTGDEVLEEENISSTGQESSQEPEEFICVECGDSFTRKIKLLKHIKKQHKTNPISAGKTSLGTRKNSQSEGKTDSQSVEAANYNNNCTDIYMDVDTNHQNNEEIGMVTEYTYDYTAMNVKQEPGLEMDNDTANKDSLATSSVPTEVFVKQEVYDPEYNENI